jgi:hypothetical protein
LKSNLYFTFSHSPSLKLPESLPSPPFVIHPYF